MTALQTLENRKYSLISAIIADPNEDRVCEIERLYAQEPCVYSEAEFKTTVFSRLKNYHEGKIVGIPHDQIKRRTV